MPVNGGSDDESIRTEKSGQPLALAGVNFYLDVNSITFLPLALSCYAPGVPDEEGHDMP
jgi:hypothetical protein